MKLGIIVNCMGYNEKVVPHTTELLKVVFPELDKLDIDPYLIMPCSDWAKIRVTKHTDYLPSQNLEKVKKLLESRNNKGMIVRLCIDDFLEQGVERVVHIDGSGKFDLKDILAVINIATDSSVDAVLTKRDKSGMSKFRMLLEEFEILLVSSKYGNQKIEDGQSGCWCIRLDHDNFEANKELTATGYEIELDILISQLKYNRNIVWLPITIKETGITKSTFEANITKLAWLSKKIGIRKEEIVTKAKEFRGEKTVQIKEAEEESAKIGDTESTFNNYLSAIQANDNFF